MDPKGLTNSGRETAKIGKELNNKAKSQPGVTSKNLCKFRITESGAKENSVQVNLTDQAKG